MHQNSTHSSREFAALLPLENPKSTSLALIANAAIQVVCTAVEDQREGCWGEGSRDKKKTEIVV